MEEGLEEGRDLLEEDQRVLWDVGMTRFAVVDPRVNIDFQD